MIDLEPLGVIVEPAPIPDFFRRPKPAACLTVLTVETRRGSGDPWRVWGCYAGRGCWSSARAAEREAVDGYPEMESRIIVDKAKASE